MFAPSKRFATSWLWAALLAGGSVLTGCSVLFDRELYEENGGAGGGGGGSVLEACDDGSGGTLKIPEASFEPPGTGTANAREHYEAMAGSAAEVMLSAGQGRTVCRFAYEASLLIVGCAMGPNLQPDGRLQLKTDGGSLITVKLTGSSLGTFSCCSVDFGHCISTCEPPVTVQHDDPSDSWVYLGVSIANNERVEALGVLIPYSGTSDRYPTDLNDSVESLVTVDLVPACETPTP